MVKNKKIKGLTIQFLPYVEIESLGATERIKKLLGIILKGKVVIIQGRLNADEETRLIEDTMALVGTVKGFKGIELAVLAPGKDGRRFFSKIKHGLARVLVGQQDALTIIGPASIVKDMKKDPRKLEMVMGK